MKDKRTRENDVLGNMKNKRTRVDDVNNSPYVPKVLGNMQDKRTLACDMLAKALSETQDLEEHKVCPFSCSRVVLFGCEFSSCSFRVVLVFELPSWSSVVVVPCFRVPPVVSCSRVYPTTWRVRTLGYPVQCCQNKEENSEPYFHLGER